MPFFLLATVDVFRVQLNRRRGRGSGGSRDREVLVPNRESNQNVVIVGLRIRVEIEIGVQLDNGVSIPLDLSVHCSAGGNGDAELGDASQDIEGRRLRRAGRQSDLGRGGSHNDGVNGVLQELVVQGLSNRVGRSGSLLWVRPAPHVDLVLGDLRERSSLEGAGVVSGHVYPGGMVETVNPILAAGLIIPDGAEVVGLAVVVPGENLDNVDLVAVCDDGLPARVVQVVVRRVDPL